MENKTTKQNIKFALKNGFLHIFSANVLNKIIGFAITLVLTRILTKSDYGSFVYAQNILNMFLLLEGLGVVPGILQYCSIEENEERKLSYFKYGIKMGYKVNILISIAILIFTSVYEMPIKGSSYILRAFFLIPLITVFYHSMQVYLRATLKNKQFSTLTILNTLIFFLGSITLAIMFKIKGVIASRYIAYIISAAIGIYILRESLKKMKTIPYPTKKEMKEFFKYSVTCCATNATSQILFLIDTFLVGMIIKDNGVVAAYKNATLIPFNLLFIPTSIVVFVYPYFAKHYDDKEWIKSKTVSLIKGLGVFNAVVTVVLIVFAKQIVLIFGKEYLDAVTPFRILMVGYFIAGTFKNLTGNVLASIKKVKVNFYTAIVAGVANIILDIVLILRFGSNGAAVATVFVYFITALISNIYLMWYLKK